jgi:hypothetical protein
MGSTKISVVRTRMVWQPGDRVAGPPPAKAVGKKKGKARSPSPKKKK